MQCEICGTDIKGPSFKVSIDGSELTVCGRCSQYGKNLEKRTPVSRKMAPVAPVAQSRKKSRSKGFEAFSDELVDDYDSVIKEAREKKQLTHDELAYKVKEKSSLIKKLERGDIVPEEEVRKKLERELDIKLTERSREDDWSGERLNKGTTLGDIVTIKRK
ncbi:multiprotein bridging factor aMBF1 [Methanolobus halotolerans]|uniref:TIGR00270 family protein n=1 Tax=Methanolobus halotolerans TaxID=2052935 RepID=A0A4E0Q1W7_9EURY|nr:multiprotein bridging factor aMBF1 [Methanolobus halotolerans]TGC11095.1 TIGR00270 family protein [Methanolobus halotolerans]